ncbi:hypothetical protein GOQ29_10000 [Clostridium sp. D2Q-14]|uniref:Mur ligase family protein n=1 Tax=Anaeromonas gelatinilytica TaxID=2683194 RepID=UPI00193C8175|nr:Mur ligase family protein [Anaeromonas gelatinilytica]MBS4535943.1 hypothetical protein [Anaeromonas gelatinilytica]
MYINDKKIKGITCNSKKVNDGYVFVAIEGKKIDGNDFIDEAIDNGAIIIFTNKDIYNKRIPIVKVKEPRKKLAKLLNEFYEYPTKGLIIIGVTGTNGKTTTTYLIERLFKNAGYKTALIGTLGVKINDVETLYELFSELKKIDIKVIILEVSSHALKFDMTYGVDFDAAIHTNIEVDHLDLHKSFDDYLNTRKILFDSLRRNRLAVINIDDENGTKLLDGNKNALTITYGLNSKSSVTASSINIQENLSFSVCIQRSIFTIEEKEYFSQEFNISTKLSELYNVYNSLAAISCALYFDIDIDIIQNSFKEIEGIPREI